MDMCCAWLLSHVWLFAVPWTLACQAPLSMGILQARILEWVAYPFSRGSSQPRNRTGVSCIAGGFLPTELSVKPGYCFYYCANNLQSLHEHATAAAAAAKLLQSCPTLCDLIDGSPPGSPIPGILQARTREWVAISFSNAWKWKWSRSVVSDSSLPHGLQPTGLLHPWDFLGKSTGVGCHCLLPKFASIWNTALSQHHFLGFEIALLEFHHFH